MRKKQDKSFHVLFLSLYIFFISPYLGPRWTPDPHCTSSRVSCAVWSHLLAPYQGRVSAGCDTTTVDSPPLNHSVSNPNPGCYVRFLSSVVAEKMECDDDGHDHCDGLSSGGWCELEGPLGPRAPGSPRYPWLPTCHLPC